MTNIGYYLLLATEVIYLPSWISLTVFESDIDWIGFSLAYSLFLASFYIPFVIKNNNRKNEKIFLPIRVSRTELKTLHRTLKFSFGLAVITVAIKFKLTGGVAETIYGDSLSRVAPLAGLGYINILSSVAVNVFAITALILAGLTKNKSTILLSLFAFIFAILVNSAYGGRKETLFLVIVAFVMHNIFVKRTNPLNIKLFPIYAVCGVYFYYVLSIRLGYLASGAGNGNELDVFSTIANLSYLDTYIFIYEYFSIDNLLLGRTFIDLALAPIPSTLYFDKPPMDEGLYVRAFSLNLINDVNIPARNFVGIAAFPPQTFGNMFMNFGYLGLIFGGILLGTILKYLNEYCWRHRSVFYFFLLYTSIFNFHISNLRIASFLTTCLVVVVLSRMANKKFSEIVRKT